VLYICCLLHFRPHTDAHRDPERYQQGNEASTPPSKLVQLTSDHRINAAALFTPGSARALPSSAAEVRTLAALLTDQEAQRRSLRLPEARRPCRPSHTCSRCSDGRSAHNTGNRCALQSTERLLVNKALQNGQRGKESTGHSPGPDLACGRFCQLAAHRINATRRTQAWLRATQTALQQTAQNSSILSGGDQPSPPPDTFQPRCCRIHSWFGYKSLIYHR
jgi:hypothetical protein